MISGDTQLFTVKTSTRTAHFFATSLGLKSVDAGQGWLIFALPPAEAAFHPSDTDEEFHELYFMCDDLKSEMATLERKGVKCSKVEEQRWGSIQRSIFRAGATSAFYQPKHPTALALK